MMHHDRILGTDSLSSLFKKTKHSMQVVYNQSEIVKQWLNYHFKETDGTWNIEQMNAPFTKEFLDEVERLCTLIDAQKETTQSNCTCLKAKGVDFDEFGSLYCVSCQKPVD